MTSTYRTESSYLLPLITDDIHHNKYLHQTPQPTKALSLSHSLSVLSGEPGCGKMTQLQQSILVSEIEAGRGDGCSILCIQHRKISAISVAGKVAAELGGSL